MLLIIKAIITKLYNDIQSWSYTNSVIVNAGGFTIGYSTYYYVSGLLALFTPLFIILKNNLEVFGKSIGIRRSGILFKIINFITNIIILTTTWLITLLITFLLLEYVLNIKLLGLKSNIKENEKKDFIISKTEASINESLIEKSKKLEIKNEKELLIGTEILKTEEKTLNDIKINNTDTDTYTDIDGVNNIEIFKEDKKNNGYNILMEKLL